MAPKEIIIPKITNIITCYGNHKFGISWSDPALKEEAPLLLDFEPLIKAFVSKKDENVHLIHWQARPKGVRRWGVYHVQSRTYIACDFLRITGTSEARQLDELKMKTIPSAVVIAKRVIIHPTSNPNAVAEVIFGPKPRR